MGWIPTTGWVCFVPDHGSMGSLSWVQTTGKFSLEQIRFMKDIKVGQEKSAGKPGFSFQPI